MFLFFLVNVLSETVLLALFPAADVHPVIVPSKNADTLFLVLDVLPLVRSFIGPYKLA